MGMGEREWECGGGVLNPGIACVLMSVGGVGWGDWRETKSKAPPALAVSGLSG